MDSRGKVATHYVTNLDPRRPPSRSSLLYGLRMHLPARPRDEMPLPG